MQSASFRSSSPVTLGLAALGLLSLGLTAAPAQASPVPAQTTINFDNLTAQAHAGGGSSSLGNSYSTQGFTFTANSGLSAIDGMNRQGDGETSLFANYGPTTLMQANKGTFDFNAIDLGPLDGNLKVAPFLGPVTFTGTQLGGGTVTDTQTITSFGFQKFSFTGFTNLQSLTFVGTYNGMGSGSLPLFDNVVLNAPAGVAPVPEASTTISLGMMLALGGLAFAVKRKKSNAAA